MSAGHPFQDFRSLLEAFPKADADILSTARKRNAVLTKPPGSLGRLEEIAMWLAAWSGRAPAVNRPMVAVFAGNHGIAARGVSAYPAEVTKQMVENFAKGGAAINQICASVDLSLKIFDLALDHPTGDISVEPALSERDCAATMAYGMEAVAGGVDLLCLGEMGIGNTTVAAALCYGLYGGSAADWVGPGTGVEGEAYERKLALVEQAVALHKDHLSDPLEALRRLGGRELAAIAGAIIAARMQKVPVLIDGYVATAAAAVLKAINPSALDHCMIAHVSAEPGHLKLVQKLGKTPLLALGMRLGEGTGAALAAGLVKAAAACHTGMATFEEAGVSDREG